MAHKKVTTASSQQKEKAVDKSSSLKEDVEFDNDVELPPLQWRCYLSYFIAKVGNWKIDDRRWALLRRKPFGKLIIDILHLEVDLEMVNALLGVWDEEHCGFLIQGSIIKFTAEDVALITGLPNGGLKVVKEKGGLKNDNQSIPFSRIYLNLAGIVRSLDKIMSIRQDPDPAQDNLFVQLMILFLWGSVLFPSGSRTVPLYLASYVEDLDAIGSYNWAEFLHSYLIKEINAKSKILKKRNEGENVVAGYISGLSFIIKVWFFVHVDFGEDSGSSNPNASRRMLKWVKSGKFLQNKPVLDRLKEIVQGKIPLRQDYEHQLVSQPCAEHVPPHDGNPCDNGPLAGNSEVLRSSAKGGDEAIEQNARESKEGRRGSKEEASEAAELRKLKKVVDPLVHTVQMMYKYLSRISDLENKVAKLEKLVASKGWKLTEDINGIDDLCGEGIKNIRGKLADLADYGVAKAKCDAAADTRDDILSLKLSCIASGVKRAKTKCDAAAAAAAAADSQDDILSLNLRCIARGIKKGCNKHRKRKLFMTKEHLPMKKKQASMPCTEQCPPVPEKETNVLVDLDDYALPTKTKEEVQSAPLSYVGRKLLSEDERIYLDAFCLKPMQREQIVFLHQNIAVRRQSMLQYLLGGCTDEEIIDAYAHILYERANEAHGKFASFLYLSPMFMGLYRNNLASYKNFMKAVNKKSLEAVCFLFSPCHVSTSNHWMLLVCDTRKKKWTALDSLYSPRHREVAVEQKSVLAEYLYVEHGFDARSWSLERKRACPQQDFGTLDCGVFVMKFMESLVGLLGEVDFRASDATLFRPRIAYEILSRS